MKLSMVALFVLAIAVAACGSEVPPPAAEATPTVAKATPTAASSPAPQPSASAGSAIRPVVFDTDMGMDDLLALYVILRDPTLDVRAIAIDGTGLIHCGAGIRNLRRILGAFDRLETFTVRLPGDEHPPEEVVATWKAAFPTYWPKGSNFYAPLSGITPGEVALLEVAPVPGSPVKMSTGVLVIYADRESFTFMTPEGHALSAWITFSAYRDEDETVVQVQALERTSDPFIELSYIFGANRANDRSWEQTLENLARSMGVSEPAVTTVKVCVDRRRQWHYVRNLRHSAAVNMAVSTVTAPARWARRRRAAN